MLTIPDASGDTSAQLCTTINEASSVNRQNLLKILLIVNFLARQDLPLRCHGNVEDSNFTQVCILWEEDNEGLKAWRTEKKINKYVESTIQNEMMQIMALRVLWVVAENIQNVGFYSTICNKATDIKNVSRFVVADVELEAHNKFIGLKNMPNTDAYSILRELKDVLLRMHLKWNK